MREGFRIILLQGNDAARRARVLTESLFVFGLSESYLGLYVSSLMTEVAPELPDSLSIDKLVGESTDSLEPHTPTTRLTGKSAPLPNDSGSFAPPSTESMSNGSVALNLLMVLVMLYVFLVGIQCLSDGIKGVGKGAMDAHMTGTLNPMLGLLAGILATTLVQSSSVTTALIVGLVASGQVSVASAVPMIMGANIGTTVTNTIASLGHATRATEFRRAFAAATCHDFFNFLSVALFLPLELITRALTGVGIIERLSGWVAALTVGAGGATYKSPIKAAFKGGRKFVESGIDLVLSGTAAKVVLAVLGVIIIFAGLAGIVRIMRKLVLTRMERYVNRFLGKGGPIGIVVGIVVTVMVQSSSITTSILVPPRGGWGHYGLPGVSDHPRGEPRDDDHRAPGLPRRQRGQG